LIFAVVAVLVVGALMAKPDLGRKVVALASALVFPTLGLIWARRLIGWDREAPPVVSWVAVMGRAILSYWPHPLFRGWAA